MWLENLQKTRRIKATKRASKYTVYMVINWEGYQQDNEDKGQDNGQDKGQDKGQERARKGPAKGHKQELKHLSTEEKENIPHGDAVTEQVDPFYLTKKKRQLKGKRLEAFNRFWAAFAYPKGKAEAADAWIDIPTLTDALVDEIVTAATAEALNRASVIADGRTPKFAQGWLSGRRWEDKVVLLQNMTPEEKAMKDAAEMRLILANKRAYQ